ncbi:MAG: DoxX family protein [Armatimonadetes bacterium]|nr:DoxX family protein [Armatimonadota bacterium]
MAELLASAGPYVNILGRVLFASFFIMSGITHLTKIEMMTQYAAAYKVPAARTMVIITGLMILAGGLAILVGWHPRIGAALIFIFLLLVAYYIHGYWRETDPMQQANQRAHFWKNVVIAGAALLIIYHGAGPLSLAR